MDQEMRRSGTTGRKRIFSVSGQTPPPQVLLTCWLLLLPVDLPRLTAGRCFPVSMRLLSGRVSTAEEEPRTSMSSSSSSGSSTPVTPEVTPQPFSSSSPAPPLLSLQSPELQAEFLKERQNKFQFHDDITSPTTSPSSPSSSCSSSPRSSSTSSSPDSRRARLSLSSPELLTELKESRTRPLRHVPAHTGMTVVFSGRGRGAAGQVSNSAPAAKPANQRISH
ncbi:hypothetical protein OJAV_G00185900 [Oryzias javanicus]|uniref:Uncharacterized protein n=1 Tax=Oryzias javanicus TaxID=123683 RepID=A0A3S2MK30_ORYJA|nr:hypothetical protein OJAV_G00185900 [Oryzias javanicus]